VTPYIERAVIQGVKALGASEPVDVHLKRATAVVGENGVGKSSVLDALYFALAADDTFDLAAITPNWGSLVHTDTRVRLTITDAVVDDSHLVEARVVGGKRVRRVMDRNGIELPSQPSEEFLAQLRVVRMGELWSRASAEYLASRLLREALANHGELIDQLGFLSNTFESAFEAFAAASSVDASRILGSEVSVGFTIFPEDLLEAIKLRLGRSAGRMFDLADDHMASIGAMVVGFLAQLIACDLATWFLLWDEPETGLHPLAQARLGSVLSESLDCQSIVATHSPFVWTEFRQRGSVVGLRKVADSILLDYDAGEQGVLVSLLPHRIEGIVSRMVESPLDAGPIVLVEGITDRDYLKLALDEVGGGSVDVVACGGTFALVPMACALRHISSRRITVVLDSDRDGRAARDILKKFGFPGRRIVSLSSIVEGATGEDVCAEDLVSPRLVASMVTEHPNEVAGWSRDGARFRYRFTGPGKLLLCQMVCGEGGEALGGWGAVAARIMSLVAL